MSTSPHRRDFLISFNSADRDWATWIATELQAAGYTLFFQHWDFPPGSDFVIEMHKASSLADRTLAVLSPAYLNAAFTQKEWAAALVQDPTGANRMLIPVRVRRCSPKGILASIVYTDLVGLNEGTARERLLAAVRQGSPKLRPKPAPSPRERAIFPPDSRKIPYTWFGAAILTTIGIIGFANRLSAYGLINQVYYLVLVALGIAAAGSLFGSLHSRPGEPANSASRAFELGGPLTVFTLVVISGVVFAPERKTFGFTFYLRGANGAPSIRNEGRVMLHLGADPRVQTIGENGTVSFSGIPERFHWVPVLITLDSDRFQLIQKGPLRLTGESLSLDVEYKIASFQGRVMDDALEPIPDGSVEYDTGSAPIRNGEFHFSLPGRDASEPLTVVFKSHGFKSTRKDIYAGSSVSEIKLTRSFQQ